MKRRISPPRKCSTCGFLSLGEDHGVDEADWMQLYRGIDIGINCARGLWDLERSPFEEIRFYRHKCKGFYRQLPGLRPSEHMQEVLKDRDSRRQKKLLVLAALVSTITTLIVNWAMKTLTG